MKESISSSNLFAAAISSFSRHDLCSLGDGLFVDFEIAFVFVLR